MSPLWMVLGGALLLNLYALTLVVLRARIFATRLYAPMVLNIGLALAPSAILMLMILGVAVIAAALPSTVLLWLLLVVGGFAWLLMLPNSAYLITELNFSHREKETPVPLWYDIVLVLTLALAGTMNTLLNLALVQSVYALVRRPNDEHPLAHADSWVLAGIVLVLVAFGMYLGRYIRFNSTDVRHPLEFTGKLRAHFAEPGRVRSAAGFCAAHAVLLGILYVMVMAPITYLI